MTHEIVFDWQTGEDEFAHAFGHVLAARGIGDRPVDLSQYQTASIQAHDGYAPFLPFDAEFDAARPVRDGERLLALLALRGVAALLFVLMAAGGAAMSPAQVDRMKIEQELAVVLDLDEEAWRARDRDRYDALIDPLVPAARVGAWTDNWGAHSDTGHVYGLTLGPVQRLDEEVVRAEVYVALPRTNWWQPTLIREKRFYRRVGDQWLRTVPTDTFWGELQTLETPFFTFRYFEADAESVAIAAEQLNSATDELYELFGLPDPSTNPRAVIVLRPGVVRSMWWDRRDIEVSSPVMAQIPRGTSDADYLTERAFSRVASRVLRTGGGAYRWAFMYTVLRGWLSADLLGQESQWRQESVDVFRRHSSSMYPLELQDIDEYYVGENPGRNTVLWRYAAASSVLDYLVEREGREVLPKLLQAFSDNGYWSPLIEDVAGVSLEEFTAGWNAYLAEEYGLGAASE